MFGLNSQIVVILSPSCFVFLQEVPSVHSVTQLSVHFLLGTIVFPAGCVFELGWEPGRGLQGQNLEVVNLNETVLILLSKTMMKSVRLTYYDDKNN